MQTETSLWNRAIDQMTGAITFDLGRYVIAALGLWAILMLFRRWSDNRRIQPRMAVGKDYAREILSSMRTVLVFAGMSIATLMLREVGLVHFKLTEYSALQFTLQLVTIIVAHDAYFYWMHRALHHKRLFRVTHLHHHKSRTPTPFAAYSFSAWEGVTEAAFVPLFLLAASSLGVAYVGWVVFAFLAWMIVRNVIGHAGVEIWPAGWVDKPWLDWLTTVTHHDLHHSQGNSNFGLYFTWWDRWMGTEHPQYKERFRAVAKPLHISRKLAEGVSVTTLSGVVLWLALMPAPGVA